jgi:acetylornithine deacetylase/succinyl-diaminopimelate desuccinylase-like protein
VASDVLDRLLTALDHRRPRTVAGLVRFLQFPSISTQPEHARDVRACADWLRVELEAAGLTTQVRETGGHPAVVGRTQVRPERPTVLVYGHYDVQPPEPLEQWQSPPFEPTVRKDESGFEAVFARGAADDKGQVWAHVAALAAWHEIHGDGGLPVNLILLIEGEEEIGSEHLEAFIAANRAELAADVAVISDTNQFARGVPAITYGLRGLCYMEVEVVGASHDLHSGLFGGAVPNAANALAQMLGGLHDEQGRVTIPGFYDGVRPLSAREKKEWAKLPFDEGGFFGGLGLEAAGAGEFGERGYTTLERRWARPTCDINGITSGYQGPGAKTVIPCRASAKVSMRLVPDQDPSAIASAFERAMRERCPVGVQISFKQHGLAPAAITPIDSPAMGCAQRALEIGFGAAPVLMREGGSIPVVGILKRQLGVDSLLVGFGLPDDRIHSPNEKFNLASLHGGARTAAALYAELAGMRG